MNTDTSRVMNSPLELIQRVEARIGAVKMLPDVALRALDVARDPESTVKEFASVVQQDFRLATDVLSMANSALYSPGRPIATLAHAIARIGFRQTRNLIVAVSLSSVMKKMSLAEEWVRDVLWKHSVTTAVIAAHLNRSLQLKMDGEEFTAGLVHDFGRTLLAVAFPEEFETFDPLDFDESEDVVARENQAIGSNHCDLGVWFAHDQGLPDTLQEVIRFHHNPEGSSSTSPLVALTITADHMANFYQREESTDNYDPAENPGLDWLVQCGVQDAKTRFQMVCTELFDKAVADAHEMFGLG